MKKVTTISVLITLVIFVVLAVCSCGQKAGDMVTQEEYDAIKAKLDAAETEIAVLKSTTDKLTVVPGEQVLKDEIASLEADIEGLESDIEELTDDNAGLTQENEAWEKRFAELETQFWDLQETVKELTTPEIITEELIENEIFNLINEERVKAGVPELLLGKQLYNHAKQNSKAMAASGKIVTDPTVTYQEVFWAANYESVESIAKGALSIWMVDQYGFEHGALLPGNIYGAVGAYKSGNIYYISFMAAFFA